MASIIVRDLPKNGTLETLNVYIKDAIVFYPVVHQPKLKYQSTDKEYSVTVFVDEESKDKLIDEVFLNKTFAEVGKTKTSKPPRRIKYPLSSQTEEGKINYDVVDGLWGFNVAKPEFSKKGNPMSVNVIDKDGNAFTDNVGNGSKCTLKLFGYKNQEGQVVVTLDTLQVIDLVPYEQKGSADSVEDDVLGVTYQVKKAEVKTAEDVPKEQSPKEQASPQSKPAPTADVDSFDDDIPF